MARSENGMRYDVKDIKTVLDEYQQGMSMLELSRKYGISRQSILRWAHKAGVYKKKLVTLSIKDGYRRKSKTSRRISRRKYRPLIIHSLGNKESL